MVSIKANQLKDAKFQAKKKEENSIYQHKAPKATMRKEHNVNWPPIERISSSGVVSSKN